MSTPGLLKRQALPGTALLALMFFTPHVLRAVIFAATDDPAYNTVEPAGALTGSGWQYQGVWNGFPGTPVSPRHFITARHIGGAIGNRFLFRGVEHVTTGVTNNGTDLNVWQVSPEFSSHALLYEGESPAGQAVVIFGRGTRRGDAIVVNGQLKGWGWGAADGVLRWGENVVAGRMGNLLRFTFDRAAGSNEVHLSSGDSGGGVFVNDRGVWKLAAINYAVEGPWKYATNGVPFQAALLDKGGLYRGSTIQPDTEADSPSSFYATPIAPSVEWLSSVINLPRPKPVAPAGTHLLLSATAESEETHTEQLKSHSGAE